MDGIYISNKWENSIDELGELVLSVRQLALTDQFLHGLAQNGEGVRTSKCQALDGLRPGGGRSSAVRVHDALQEPKHLCMCICVSVQACSNAYVCAYVCVYQRPGLLRCALPRPRESGPRHGRPAPQAFAPPPPEPLGQSTGP